MAKNTLMLYVRMFLLILVQLYTVPVILKNLGVEDYGIYNVVGGVVTLFSFVGGSLASGTQRFLSYAIGKGDDCLIKSVFNNTWTIYMGFAVFLLIVLEIGGMWFLNTQMNIPEQRLDTANWVFQLSLLAFLINLVSIPYNSTIIAHEQMSFYAYVSILECFLKLGAAVALTFLYGDKLLVYAVLVCAVSIIIRMVYRSYCVRNFSECKNVSLHYDSRMGKSLIAYSGWNVIGSVAMILRTQGINIVLNVFFGPLLNAAHSIAQQISGVLTQFINNVYMATRPQITKKYAQGDVGGMWGLVFHSNKLAFFLLLYLGIPTVVELSSILAWWIPNAPEYTVIISRLLILSLLAETLINQIIGAFQAVNRIKTYQLYASTILILNVPASYFVLKYAYTIPCAPYIVSLILSFIYIVSIIYIAWHEIGMDVKAYVHKVLFPSVMVALLAFGVTFGLSSHWEPGISRVIITLATSTAMVTLFSWSIGLDRTERTFIMNIIKQKTKKIRSR